MAASHKTFVENLTLVASALKLPVYAFPVAIANQEAKSGPPPITKNDWHQDMEIIANTYKIYQAAAKDRPDLFPPPKTSSKFSGVLSIERFNVSIAASRSEIAIEEMRRLAQQSKGGEGTSTEYADKLLQTKQASDNAASAAMKLLLISEYANRLIPPAIGSPLEVAANENLELLKQMWEKPENRDAMRQSWDNLMKEAYFLDLPENPFPLDN